MRSIARCSIIFRKCSSHVGPCFTYDTLALSKRLSVIELYLAESLTSVVHLAEDLLGEDLAVDLAEGQLVEVAELVEVAKRI